MSPDKLVLKKRLVLYACVALLLSAFSFQWLSLNPKSGNRLGTSLEDVLGPALQNAKVTPLLVGATEFETGAAERILKYDDVLYKNIDTNAHSFQLFVTYWKKGKIAERRVTGHTPDTCWISNGWTCLVRHNDFEVTQLKGSRLNRWEYGEYQIQGMTKAALFVHLAGGSYSRYKVKGHKSIMEWLPIAFSQGFRTRTEQVFIRITWDVRGREPYDNEVFQDIVRRLESAFFYSNPDGS